MKRLCSIILALLAFSTAFAQGNQPQGAPTQLNSWRGAIKGDSAFYLPANYTQYRYFDSCGRMWFNKRGDSAIYFNDCNKQVKVLSMKDTAMIRAMIGNITGQVDSSVFATRSWSLGQFPLKTDVVPSARTITINGTTQDLSTNRTFNVGTVTSVAAMGFNGMGISGSPVTGSGTLSFVIDTAGTIAGKQYVDNTATLILNSLGLYTYDFQKYNPANATVYTTGTDFSTRSITADGFNVVIPNGSGNTQLYFFGNLGVMVPSYGRYTITQRITNALVNPAFGAGFGDYNTSYFGVGYRQTGELTMYRNGVLSNLRPATPGLAWNIGDTIGLDILVDKIAGTATIRTIRNGAVDNTPYVVSDIVNWAEFYIFARTKGTFATKVRLNVLNKADAITSVIDTSSLTKTVFVNLTNGSDAYKGSIDSPVATYNKAIQLGRRHGRINIYFQGTGLIETRGSMNNSSLTYEDVHVYGPTNGMIMFLGSDSLANITKTGGYTNVYQAARTTAVPATSNGLRRIWEHMRPSDSIAADSQRHSLNRGYTYRMPTTELLEVVFNTNLATTLAILDTTRIGGYYHDVSNNIIYFRSASGGALAYRIEVPARPTTNPPSLTYQQANIEMRNISFWYSSGHGATLYNYNKVQRMNCWVYGACLSGFVEDDSKFIETDWDIAAACGNDGIQSTHTANYVNNLLYYNSMHTYRKQWSYRNRGDGNSHHARSDVFTIGCVFEFDGKSGNAPASGCQWTAIGDLHQFIGGFAGRGECVEVINPPVDGRSGTVYNGHNVTARWSVYGFTAFLSAKNGLNLFNCTSVGNSAYNYYADAGYINAYDCNSTNADPAKHKGTSNSGSIRVRNNTKLDEGVSIGSDSKPYQNKTINLVPYYLPLFPTLP